MNKTLPPPLSTSNSFQDQLESIPDLLERNEGSLSIEGLTGSSKAFFLSQAWKVLKRPIVILTQDQNSGETILENLRYFFKHHKLKIDPRLFPTWELLPYEPLSPLAEVSGERLDILDKLLGNECPVLILPIEAAMQYVIPRAALKNSTYTIKTGDKTDREVLETCLVGNGFIKSRLVEERGQFSFRGDILDLFPGSYSNPVRIEFFGDEVEAIRHFDITSQISFENLEAVKVLPVKEICLTKDQLALGIKNIENYKNEFPVDESKWNELLEKVKCLENFSGIENLAPFFYPDKEGVFDYFTEDTLVVLDEKEFIESKRDAYHELILEEYSRLRDRGEVSPSPENLFMEPEEFDGKIFSSSVLTLNALKLSSEDTHIPFDVKPIPILPGHFDEFVSKVIDWQKDGYEVTVVAPTKGHVKRVNELLVEKEITVTAQQGLISSGFLFTPLKKIFVAEHELFGRTHKHRHRRRSKGAAFQRGFQDLKPNDLLVHIDYGIGQYLGTKEIKTGIGGGEFMEILYADDEKLYIPMDGLAFIQKYVGAKDTSPHLNKLGGVGWKRQKGKIKKAIQEVAEELLKVYAARELAKGTVYSSNTSMVQEFSDSFEFAETDDQFKAIEDVFEDMSREKPMDRLICGDVGYGKTEVAMRAAFRAILDKKQVAVLVPTTILAQQHLNTFKERFRSYPVNIDMVSRFRSAKEQKETIGKLKQGKVDIIIGTHRLLSKDVDFSNLGLIIIDEEQRFGVRHKEKLKKLRASVDILTLTATPIPRTLHFSLMGVRDLSVIETPPSDRLSIKTYVRKFDESTIHDAVIRELDRGGQIYFVHNKIKSIHSTAAMIHRVAPQVRVGIAHGQLPEKLLEEVMRKFIDKEIDLLLCTSIVESGLDIPSANTIIINRADQFGLAQLYQLRGRVGRYKHQAYAYLLIPGATVISSEARKRLFAIEEMSELGAGFQLAARDMEIRGTGNMLGGEQSGHITAIGFELYCKMIEETIKEMKGEKIDHKIDIEIDFQIKGYIPKDYIPDLNQRLEICRRLQLITDVEGLSQVRKEMIDRYGDVPEPAEKILSLLEIKLICQALHISRVRLIRNRVMVKIEPTTPISSQKAINLMDNRLKFISENELSIQVDGDGWKNDIKVFKTYLEKFLETEHVSS